MGSCKSSSVRMDSKGEFTQYPFFVRFRPFFSFLLLLQKVCAFSSAFL